MADLNVKIGNLHLKNPVLTASGTCGFGSELSDFINLEKLGGIIMKGLTLAPREGNRYPRMAETASGMLNAVGLQNPGIDFFISNIYPELINVNTNFIVNVNGSTIEEYVELTRRVDRLEAISAIELNISCPNVKQGGMAFGVCPETAASVIREVRRACHKTLIVKLSPNVTDIAAMAKVAENEGADAVSLVNTLLGMAIDATTRKPLLSTVTGGLSGPAIKPVALRMVWQASRAVKIPVIGVGGICTATDAIEFMLAGATAVQVGTATFRDPQSTVKIVEGINEYTNVNKFNFVNQIIGALEM
ncbi:MAG: dihydroorotate dehydrogenase [Bacteroidales bacterium]|jgi:dihydroorotate dehydrogenase (NAD+) catalytic subunit|nr:dihydroorotate dehydrogenase [Bacteroidales bacterium]